MEYLPVHTYFSLLRESSRVVAKILRSGVRTHLWANKRMARARRNEILGDAELFTELLAVEGLSREEAKELAFPGLQIQVQSHPDAVSQRKLREAAARDK